MVYMKFKCNLMALTSSHKPTSKGWWPEPLGESVQSPQCITSPQLGVAVSAAGRALENHYRYNTGHPTSCTRATHYLGKPSSARRKNIGISALISATAVWVNAVYLFAINCKAFISTQRTSTGSKCFYYFLRAVGVRRTKDGIRWYTQELTE